MKKIAKCMALLLAVLMVLSFTACSSNEGGNASGDAPAAESSKADEPAGEKEASAEPYEIHVICSRAADDKSDYGYCFGRILDEYCAEHPNFSYDYEVVAQMEIPGKISLLIASDEVPDFFVTEAGGSLNEIIASGGICDMDEALGTMGLKFDDLVEEPVKEAIKGLNPGDGCYYLPTRYAIDGVWYNKNMFAENNLEVPKTWEDMIAICDAFMAKDIQPFACGGQGQWPVSRWCGMAMTRMLGHDAVINASFKNDGITFTSEGYADSVKYMSDLFAAGYFGTGWNSIDNATAISMFCTGETAMCYYTGTILPSLLNPEINKIGTDAIGVFNVPNMKDAKTDENGAGMCIVNPGQALCFGKAKFDEGTNNDFLKSLVEKLGGYIWDLGAISPYKCEPNGELDPFITDVVLKYHDTVEYTIPWFEGNLSTEAANIAFQEAQLLSEGQTTPEQFCQAMADAVG